MLSQYPLTPTLATADMAQARSFYEGTLGFVADESVPEGVMYEAGPNRFLVYESAFAGTNKATSMGFQVPAEVFDAEIADLRDRGITFDTFDAEGLTWDEGVASMGDQMRAAWFHDLDGNIIAVETSA